MRLYFEVMFINFEVMLTNFEKVLLNFEGVFPKLLIYYIHDSINQNLTTKSFTCRHTF